MKGLWAGVLVALFAAHASAEPVVHSFLEVALSPDGRHVAAIEGDSSSAGGAPILRDLVLRSADGKAVATVPLPCGRVAQCWPSAIAWRPDGKGLAFALRKPGSHDRAIYSVNADGSQLKQVLAVGGTLNALRYNRQGDLAMLATVGATKELGAVEAGAPILGDLAETVPQQRIAILAKDGLRWMSPADLFVYQYDWLADGSGFVGTAAHGDGDNNWWVAKLYSFGPDGAAKVIYSPPDARHQIADPTMLPDGRHVAFISGIMSDFGSTGGDVYSLDRQSGEAVDLTPQMPASASALGLSCEGHLLVQSLAGDKTEFRDLSAGKALLWSGEGVVEEPALGYAETCPGKLGAVIVQSFTQAPEIAIGTLGNWKQVTHSNAALSAKFTVRSIAWDSDGAHVQGWLLLPPQSGHAKLPMVTIIHGGPAAAARPYYIGPGLTHSLLDHGYALFLPNPRGSYGQGEAFTQANVKDFGYGDLKDILAGIDAVEKAAPIDDARLGVLGHSYGGFMTMWAVTQTSRFKAAVAGAGIANWQSYYGQNGIDQWMIPYFGASVYDDAAVYAKSSPINYIHGVKTPVFTYVGAEDVECPAAQTMEFDHALKAMGVPSSMVIYPGEGHAIHDPAHLADRVQRTLGWFDRYLNVSSAPNSPSN